MKRVKKLLSLILLATILFTDIAPVAVLAVENTPQPKTVALDAITPKGNIEIETHLAFPVRNTSKNNITFKISNTKDSASLSLNAITKAKDGIYDDTIELGNQKDIRIVATKRDFNGNLLSGIDEENNIVYLSINLYSLNKGKYTLEFSGDKFVTYKTDVTLDDTSKRVSFSNEKGMFELGDVNGDNKVDTKDSDAIDKSIGTKDADYDLNLDGVVDIADLNYVTAIINGQSGKVKIENTSAIIDTNNIDLSMTGTSVSSGNIENIFTDEGMVTLKPEKEAPISADNPVSLDINLEKNNQPVEMEEIRLSVGENMPTDGTVIVETQSGEKIEKPIEDITKEENGVYKFTEVADENVITISLGKQVAVKKVTIKITGTKTNNLADIAKVEFLNNVKTEAPKPADLSIPKNIKIDESESEKLTVSFSNVPNVTGYEIKIVGKKMESGKIFQTTYNKFTIEDLKNYQTYKIYVQAVNGEWKTGWSTEYTGMPTTKVKPPKPDDVSATGTFSGIDFKWKDMDDTLTYNLYYKKVGDKEFKKYSDEPIEKNSFELRGLEPATEYQAYITGVNPNGEGPASQIMKAKTLKKEATITPKYKLINDTVLDGKTNHIKDVIYTAGENVGGTMVNGGKFSMVDDDFMSYWQLNDWTSGTYNGNNYYPIVELDNKYTMDEFVITVPDEYAYSYKSGSYEEEANNNDFLLRYWNNDGEKTKANRLSVRGTLSSKKDKNGRKYYVAKLKDPIEANAVQLGLTVVASMRKIQVSELKLYEYDSLVDDVANLFTDDLRIELDENVDQAKIDNLRNRANQKDHDEYSPYRDSVLMDLEYAEKILNDKNASKDVITMNSEITNAYNGNKGFAMTLNDYQPLGIVAKPGETLNVYVGSKGNVNAELVYTQHYAQPSAWSKSVKLTKGQNIIKIDKITSVDEDEAEGGGSLYVRYTGTPDTKNPIKLRVSGGHKIPVLDTSLLDNENAKKTAIKTYIDELKNYNASLKETYSKEGKTFKNDTSVLGATEIATKYGLFSVSSVAVENAINAELTNENDKINRLYESTEAFDEMMLYFYRQKGFSSDVDAKDANGMTKSRINIRYMRMFYGAFMYAGGFHIGIEYGSIAGLIQANRHSDDKTGYFGWGISHEVGHQINEKSTVFAEVTNNIYALLAQSSNDKDETRLENSKIYDKIYNKVTSHTTGRDQNVFVQLGMYWQLHLAYDDNKTFTDKDSIFAKVNKIAREYKNTNNYSRDELTILFASMAAKKNLIDYFATWGLKPSSEKAATLKNEIEQIEIADGKKIEKENKAIYYLNDEARRYRLKNLSNLENAKISNDVTVDASIAEASSEDKRVTINLGVNKEEDKILGYEILRNGTSVGFVTKDNKTFVDNIGAENNRAYIYEVVAYDYLLNKLTKKIYNVIIYYIVIEKRK